MTSYKVMRREDFVQSNGAIDPLSVNTLKVNYRQNTVCVCVCVDDWSDFCIFVQLLPLGYNVDKRDTCHIELAY